jgi:hypothetical protein
VDEWGGPEDDGELIALALKVGDRSLKANFGGGLTFRQLWEGDVPSDGRSEADQSLANHLAFWTGKNCERIERLMRASPAYRNKWDAPSHANYLTTTILKACSYVVNVAGDRKAQAVAASGSDPSSGNGSWPETTKARSSLTFRTPTECEAGPSRGYVVKGIMAPGDVGCIFGAPGAGKSLLGPHLAYAVAQGRPVFGMRTKPGIALYVSAEDSHGMRGRVTALKMVHGDAPNFFLVDGVSDLLIPDGPDLLALFDEVLARKPALVIIDTLAMAFPGLEENNAEGMGRVVAVARKLADLGAAVVLIHHDTKAEGTTPRGHSLLNGALDFALHVKRDGAGVVRASLTKNRNGSCERDIAFKIGTREFGKDEDGDPMTAGIAEELAGGAGLREPKLSPATEEALKHLKSMLADKAGQLSDMSCTVYVTEADWRRVCVTGGKVSSVESLDSRRKAFDRAFTKLAREGLILVSPEGVSVPRRNNAAAVFGLPKSPCERQDSPDRHGQAPDMSGGGAVRQTRTHPLRGVR